MKNLKALLIDSATKEIKEVVVKDYTDLYKLLGNGCNNFAAPVELPNHDTLFVDDEGLYHCFKGGYKMKGWGYPIVGNGVLQGCNINTGNSINVKTTKEELEKMIIWVSVEECNAWADRFN